jgi:hypothetical protein
VDQWKESLEQNWYHLRLEDHSIFVFDTVRATTSYSFLDRPIDVPTFREYLTARGLAFDTKNRERFSDEYQEVMATAALRRHITPIRYDQDTNAYRIGVHPAAHIHIGVDNPIRIPVRRYLDPRAFVLFVIRQMYPECWERLQAGLNPMELERSIRHSLQQIEEKYFQDLDQCQAVLT